MWGYLAFVIFARLACGLVTPSPLTAPIVDVGYAQYQGSLDAQTNITSFLGIRFAVPPLGTLRFKAPQPPVAQTGIQPATQNPSVCYQAPIGGIDALVAPFGQNTSASEDCLFLNVFVPGTVPPNITEGGLPVLVWIYGGGYQFGGAAQYNGSDLVVDSLNTVVVVVIQYRLGAFGFLSGNEVKAHGALNAGLLDQNFALQWIQEHIGSFGGDKDHVTIWGESAGGGSVLQHIVAHGGNTQPPLFNGAITSSVFLGPQYYYNHRIPQYNQVVNMTGCASSADTFACLQSLNTSILQSANTDLAFNAFYGTSIFIPVVDGEFIVERPTVTLSKGRVNGQVLLTVNNQDEGGTIINPNETLTTADYVSSLFPDMTSFQVQKAVSIYQEYGSSIEQASLVYADSLLVCPSYYLLDSFAGRSWRALFAIPPAFHDYDLYYYFYSAYSPPPYNNKQFIAAFSESFMSLAKYYDVNTKFDPTNITPNWNKYVINATEMLFNRTEAGAPEIVPIQTNANLLRRCAYHDANKKFDPTNIMPDWDKYVINQTVQMTFNRTEAGIPIRMNGSLLLRSPDPMTHLTGNILFLYLDINGFVDVGIGPTNRTCLNQPALERRNLYLLRMMSTDKVFIPESKIEVINGDLTKSYQVITGDSLFPYRLVLQGDGTNLVANFEPKMRLLSKNTQIVAAIDGSMGIVEGGNTQEGSGVFQSKHSVPMGLSGTYRLQVGPTTARLFDGDEQIWIGKGTQEGLDGVFDFFFW